MTFQNNEKNKYVKIMNKIFFFTFQQISFIFYYPNKFEIFRFDFIF